MERPSSWLADVAVDRDPWSQCATMMCGDWIWALWSGRGAPSAIQYGQLGRDTRRFSFVVRCCFSAAAAHLCRASVIWALWIPALHVQHSAGIMACVLMVLFAIVHSDLVGMIVRGSWFVWSIAASTGIVLRTDDVLVKLVGVVMIAHPICVALVAHRGSGRGTCLADGTCSCATGFSGSNCSLGLVPSPVFSTIGAAGQAQASQEQCPLGCCGRGQCEEGACICNAGWFGPGCSADAPTWRSSALARRGRRETLLEEARERRAQADKARLLATTLARVAEPGGSMRHRLALLLADAGTLAADAEAIERVAAAALASEEPLFLDTCAEPAASAALIQTRLNRSTENCLGGCSEDHGLCHDGVCYCHTAYWGAACTYKRQLRMIPGPLRAVEVVAVAFVLVLLTACLALCAAARKEAARQPPV